MRDLHVREGHRKHATFEVMSLHIVSLVGFAGGLEDGGNLFIGYTLVIHIPSLAKSSCALHF